MILIIATADDVSVPPVTKRLDEFGAAWLRFDPTTAPSDAEISVEHARNGAAVRRLHFGGTTLDLTDVRAVWNRAKTRPVADASVKPDQAWWVAENYVRVLLDLYECMDCLWLPERPSANLNPFRARRETDAAWDLLAMRNPAPSANNKFRQLELAGSLGFSVPRTLVSNVPERFLEFYEACDGRVISKRAANVNAYREGHDVGLFTYPVQRHDLVDYQSVRLAPVVFQERVEKQVELRVTVVGEKAFAAEIHSQESNRLQTDWRHYATYGRERHYAAHVLPAEVEARCVKLVESLGLCFGAMDLILTPSGEYVFLEVNIHGQYLWMEEATGLPISNAVAELLFKASTAPAA